MNAWAVGQIINAFKEFVAAYRERTQQQRESTELLVQIQREQLAKLSS